MATDTHGRRIDYLRISLTDRCNLRCVYCMPSDGVVWKSHEDVLTYEEIERFAHIAVAEGISKVRLTGGEPLVRTGVPELVRRLINDVGVESVALTTNAILLPRFAEELRDAGLSRVNISLDSLDAEKYSAITRGGRLEDALAGLDAAVDVGFGPIKVNAVVVRSLRQDFFGFASMTLDRPLHVRFIEYMPVGEAGGDESGGTGGSGSGDGCDTQCASGWTRADSVPSDEVLASISAAGVKAGVGELIPVAKDDAPGGWGPARYYRFAGAQGTVGVISPLSHHFCAECNRLRLTADGRLRPCLFSDMEFDVRGVLRQGTDSEVRDVVREALRTKPRAHDGRIGTQRGMSQIGG